MRRKMANMGTWIIGGFCAGLNMLEQQNGLKIWMALVKHTSLW
jgi:hypothetical protein